VEINGAQPYGEDATEEAGRGNGLTLNGEHSVQPEEHAAGKEQKHAAPASRK
jgi:hypothetical protein